MENLHLKNLKDEQIIIQLSNDPELCLRYILFKNHLDKTYDNIQFINLPILENFSSEITNYLYCITRLSNIDELVINKIVSKMSLTYNEEKLLNKDNQYFLINKYSLNRTFTKLYLENIVLNHLFTTEEIKEINKQINNTIENNDFKEPSLKFEPLTEQIYLIKTSKFININVKNLIKNILPITINDIELVTQQILAKVFTTEFINIPAFEDDYATYNQIIIYINNIIETLIYMNLIEITT